MDDLTTYFLKKVTDLEKVIDDTSKTRADFKNEVVKIRNWLTGNRSLQQHRLCQKYLTYLWQSYGGEYNSRDGFVMRIKVMLGFADIKEKRFKDKSGNVCRDRMIAVKSLSFAECTQKDHQKFFNDLKEYAMKQWGVDFLLWEQEYLTNPDLLQ